MNDLAQMDAVDSQQPVARASVFAEAFRSLNSESIAKQLREDGFYVFENAINGDLVDTILAEASTSHFAINHNDVAPVAYFRQKFFAHVLASSPTIMKIITDPVVLKLCGSYLGPRFRLKCQRYYESGLGYQLGWHTDNKTVDNKKTDVKGIVFIIYLTDTYDGELQVVKGSNNWSGEALSNDFVDEDLRKTHPADIKSLPGPRGTVVITDTYTVHRTRLLTTPGFVRKSLFFQVDDDLMHSEKIILNTEYLPPLNVELMRYLGFGLPSGYKSMPASGLHTLTNKDLRSVVYRCTAELLTRSRALRTIVNVFRSQSAHKQ